MTFLHSLAMIGVLYPVFLAPLVLAARKGWLPALTEGKEDA